jgi:hypothetical protein
MKRMMAHEAMQLAERTTAEFCNTVKRGGVSSVGIKVAQGYTWTGYYDSGPAWDINNFDAMTVTQADFEAQGIKFQPWCCPMGLMTDKSTPYYDDASARAEAEFYARIANRCGYLDMDIEPYPEFCPPLARGDYRWVVPFFSQLRALAPDAYLVLDVPNRDSDWEGGKVGPLISMASPYINAVHVQTYFGVADQRSQMQRARAHTTKPVYPIIACTPNFADQLEDAANDPNIYNVSVWVAQNMNAAYYEQLASVTFDDDEPMPVEPLIEWQQPGFSALAQQLGEAMGNPTGLPYADNIGNVFQDGSKGFALWRKDHNANYFNPYPD